jgi:hypothetical protein
MTARYLLCLEYEGRAQQTCHLSNHHQEKEYKMMHYKLRKLVGMAAISALFLAPGALAEGMDHGTLAAAIRSADLPCNHVISASQTAENTWSVQCNAGTYEVTREEVSSSKGHAGFQWTVSQRTIIGPGK